MLNLPVQTDMMFLISLLIPSGLLVLPFCFIYEDGYLFRFTATCVGGCLSVTDLCRVNYELDREVGSGISANQC